MKSQLTISIVGFLVIWAVYAAGEIFYFHPRELDLAQRGAANAVELAANKAEQACIKERLADNKRFREWLEKIINQKPTGDKL